ncbi:[FeFe] hydrogenase H-cluster radical SAM maturase HydE [Amedibacterium intestinale]|uniref:[FeFe] hydrogenase H-cluster radical SAM maturase HydE n=1 Tax=Amedibacterium intestinale TaxID=2583452 RepID=A0A6N4TKA0_9FIRM|nr:radical SAM protein [Amedibacterium intestinale]BBK22835.1 [FeFe] hydrogenase H-cluster radical SAM maturase HydE [Amedibacterium intestinale]
MRIMYENCLQRSKQLIENLENMDVSSSEFIRYKELLSYPDNCIKIERYIEEGRKIRNHYFGSNLYIRASIEISNICDYKCKFCGMSVENKELERYCLSVEEVKQIIDYVYTLNITQIHLASGESTSLNIENLCEIIRYAKKRNLNVTLVLGRRKLDDYIKLRKCGADRYILKFETSNKDLYYKIKSNTRLQDRIADLLFLREIGFKIGTGTIIGLPGTSISDYVKDIQLLKYINPDMSSVSVFTPNAQSAFKNELAGDLETAVRFVALMRHELQKNPPYISCSSSFGIKGQEKVLNAGGNVISFHATPEKVIDSYSSYQGKGRIKTKKDVIEELASLCDLTISQYY